MCQAPAAPAVKSTEKGPKKSSEKPGEKKGKKLEPEKQEPLDPVAEKLRQQRYIVLHHIWFFHDSYLEILCSGNRYEAVVAFQCVFAEEEKSKNWLHIIFI